MLRLTCGKRWAAIGMAVAGGLFADIAGAQTIYVDAANNSGVENGSQANPYNTIQEGVAVVPVGGTVQVAAGVYAGRVTISNRVGMTIQGAAGAQVQQATDFKFLVDRSRDIVIRGFDIRGGNRGFAVHYSTNVVLEGNQIQSMYSGADGYPIYGIFSKVVVRDSLIQSNNISYGYAAGYFYSCSLEYANNDVLACEAGNSSVGGVQVINNDSGVYAVTIRDNFFSGVKANYKGALDLYCKGALDVTRNVFVECGPRYRSDGVGYSYDCGGMVDVYLFAGATNHFVNNVFRNPAYHYNGPFKAVHIRNGSSSAGILEFRNNIFQNDAPYTNYTPTGAYAIWNQSTMTPVSDYNLVSGMSYQNVTPGTGSLSANPLFVNPAAADYHLAAGSPAINAGHPDAQYNDADGSRNDMGAFGGSSGGGGGGGGGGNTAPVAQPQNVTTAEDTSKAITLTATDAETNALTYAIVGAPANGSLLGTPPAVTYYPLPNFYGSDSFTFRASDGSLTSNVATVSITVTAVNDAPVAQNQSVTTTQGVAKAVTLVASDVDNVSLTYSIVANPANGTLSGTAPNLAYTPAAGFSGADSFRFRAYDGALYSNTGTVSITVVALQGGTVYVDDSNTSGIENGSLANPYNTIQEGVNAAASGAVVQVAAGTYPESLLVFKRRSITLQGAGAASLLTATNEKIRVIDSEAITVGGFTLRGGSRAGVYVSQSTNILVRNSTIEDIARDPYASGSGGGFEAYTSSVAVVSNVIRNIQYVNANRRGGGQFGGAGYFIGCTLDFVANTVTNCYAWNSAGGVYVKNTATGRTARIARNTFELTTADYSGAIDAIGYFNQLTVENNTIARSGATCGSTNGLLGAVRVDTWSTTSPILILNNVVSEPLNAGCVAGGARVAVYLANAGNIYAANNILFSSVAGHAIRSRVPASGVTAQYNDAYGLTYLNVTPGTGSIAAHPQFVSATDYHLQSGSLCINAGDPAAQYNDLNGTRNDMGRYGGPNGY